MNIIKDNSIKQPSQTVKITEGTFEGADLIESNKTLGQLKDMFLDENSREKMDQSQLIYHVQAHLPVPEGTEGGLFFGTTWIESGTVNGEYFMTHGHFHQVVNRAEYYWGIKGEGVLILMDQDRNGWAEYVYPGSLHYIPAYIAHRVANTGDEVLSFGACWPSDAGHNYDEIKKNGFSKRLFKRNGVPSLEDVSQGVNV